MSYTCAVCNKVVAVRVPKGGDGSLTIPYRHKHKGKLCMGSFMEANWPTTEVVGRLKRLG